jgi:hypothetical protein
MVQQPILERVVDEDRELAGGGGMGGLGELAAVLLAKWATREIALGRTESLRWSTALWSAHGLFRDYGVRAG